MDVGGTADHGTTRRHNLSVVLSHLRREGPRSRARVAEETGLNKATVSSLVADLISRGLAIEGRTERGGIGRPGQVIEVDGGQVWAIGTEIKVGHVSALAVDLRGQVVAEQNVLLDTHRLTPAEVLSALKDAVQRTFETVPGFDEEPMGLAVAVPGLVESASGVLTSAPNLGWRSVPVIDEMRRLLDEPPYPVILENEANFAAVAELNARELVGADVLLVTGATGVGGGVVADGHLLRGGRGFAGEVGHMQVDPDGHQCACGRRGCWETLVGLHVFLAAAADPDDYVHDPAVDVQLRLSEIARRAEAGDGRTLDAIARVGSWLAVGAGILIDILNPDLLVFGGYYGTLAPWLVDSIQANVEAEVFAPDTGGCKIEFSTLGFSASLIGGAQSALDIVFQDPSVVPVRAELGRPVA